MTISFHCEHCGKKIEAPDSAGGKWGKCPACRNKVYVPGLDSDDELKLAPIDEKDLAEQRRLMAETRQVEQEILSEKVVPEGSVETDINNIASDASEKELTKNIIVYLRQMADGELDHAERLSNAIAPYRSRALEILDIIALSEIPEPELADIPQQVLSGLIRTLRNRIG
jgi:DNA-directed RNA polymerase subunit RPC12/RpoP